MLIGLASQEIGMCSDKVIIWWIELLESGYAYWNEADDNEAR
jgi:hypothetical protein